MPIYEYFCRECREISDHFVPMTDRTELQDCPICGSEKSSELRVSAPIIGTEVMRGDARIIKDERQLKPGWRDEGTTRRPGGAGKRIHFHA